MGMAAYKRFRKAETLAQAKFSFAEHENRRGPGRDADPAGSAIAMRDDICRFITIE